MNELQEKTVAEVFLSLGIGYDTYNTISGFIPEKEKIEFVTRATQPEMSNKKERIERERSIIY